MGSKVIALVLHSLLGQAEPTAAYVHRLAPRLSVQRAQEVAVAIEAAAKRYDVDPMLLAAIIKQETDFRTGQKSCWIVQRYAQCRVTCDHGLAQINELWIAKWNLDQHRLLHDDAYNIRIAARILAQLQKTHAEAEPENWYGRYHSGTPSKKAVYLARLETHLALQ